MLSPKRGQIVAALVLVGVGGLAYSVGFLGQVVVGAGVALSAFVVAALVYYGGTDRRTLTLATTAVTVVYGVFTLQLPMAIIAACTVYLAAWLTGSDSPFNTPDTEIFPVRRTATEQAESTE